jgi:hypothetical protein
MCVWWKGEGGRTNSAGVDLHLSVKICEKTANSIFSRTLGDDRVGNREATKSEDGEVGEAHSGVYIAS